MKNQFEPSPKVQTFGGLESFGSAYKMSLDMEVSNYCESHYLCSISFPDWDFWTAKDTVL